MRPVFPARRRADEFSSLVEDPTSTRLRDTDRSHADLAPLLDLVAELRSTPSPQARPEFVSDLRGRLLLAAETTLVPVTPEPVGSPRQPAPRRTGRERRLAVAVGGFALISASASMSVAAQTALPGDTLYPLKRAIEDVHERALRDADDKGTTMLGNASGRLDEVDRLSRTGDQDAAVIAETLQDFSDQAAEASDLLLDDYAETGRLSSIEELQAFTESSRDALDRLEGLVPVEARSSLIAATRVLDRITQDTLSACPTCAVLPLLGDAVSAVGVGPLFESVLETAPAPAPVDKGDDDVRPSRPTRNPPTAPAAEADPAPVDTPTQAPQTEPTDPPALPQGPRSGGGDKDPLGGIVADLGDPLGDLLTGTGELVDGLLAPPGTDKPK